MAERTGKDFEREWLIRFAHSLQEMAGEDVRDQVLLGSEGLSSSPDRAAVIEWTRSAMGRLERLTDAHTRQRIMLGCACHYPRSELQDLRQHYEETGDLDAVHAMLQARFESFLRDAMGLTPDDINEILARGWGLAGVRDGHTITATKIPRSENLRDYLSETDPDRRRTLYCHCPRVREAVSRGETLPATYCYCGAGFYQAMWEEILQRPVEIEVQETVLQGGNVCRFIIRLPADA